MKVDISVNDSALTIGVKLGGFIVRRIYLFPIHFLEIRKIWTNKWRVWENITKTFVYVGGVKWGKI